MIDYIQYSKRDGQFASIIMSGIPIFNKKYEDHASFRDMPDVEFSIPDLTGKGSEYITETVSLLEQYVDYIPSIGYDYRKNPWYGYINQDTSYQTKAEVKTNLSTVSEFAQTMVTLRDEIKEKYGIWCTRIEDAHACSSFFNLAATSTNRKEAEFIVDLIYQNIEKYPSRSLGVVAFSVAQQDLIDKLLSRRRQATPEKEYFFKSNVNEPFFIKNLETVQGDERDTIIFSIAYGMDADGRLLHNFGPLNRAGGERRLNVAVTRAKCNVQLVSSMHYTDIDVKRTSSEGAKLLREYLDYAENGNIALERTISVGQFEQFDSDFELEVCEFLRSQGFTVDTQVGCSGFRIDLGLRLPNSSDYVLAIECDGATYHSSKNARDRDRLRQEILERMGWKFYRIWSTDWFKNKSVEKQRLLEIAIEAVKNPTKVEAKPIETPQIETFEEIAVEKHFEFPPYKAANIDAMGTAYLPRDFLGMIRAILEVEAPLSEDLLLKRIVGFFGRTKVTSVVQRAYEQQMFGCQRRGIIRKDGFLYLNNDKEIRFRGPGDIVRDIKQIAPEELAVGMLEILNQNVSADKNGLYRSLAMQCGVSRVGKAVNESMDAALEILKDRVNIDGDVISIK